MAVKKSFPVCHFDFDLNSTVFFLFDIGNHNLTADYSLIFVVATTNRIAKIIILMTIYIRVYN